MLTTLEDLRAAHARIADRIVRTPLMPTLWAEQRLGTERRLWLKPENLQATGAFKIRGALNAVGALDDGARGRGVLTHSSGNHGQAVAYAARAHGVKATVVMPDVSPGIKVDAVRALGAEAVLVPSAERERRAEELVAEHGYVLVPPYDHADVIAGQGTLGLELAEDLPEVATVVVPVGGGGLISGVAAAVKALRPSARMIGVEPELAADVVESRSRGERVAWPVERTYRTMADGVRTPLVGALTWEHIHAYVDDVVTVTEDQIGEAVGLLARRSRVVAEPSGALATAAYLAHHDVLPVGPVVAVVSGGNLDPALLARFVAD